MRYIGIEASCFSAVCPPYITECATVDKPNAAGATRTSCFGVLPGVPATFVPEDTASEGPARETLRSHSEGRPPAPPLLREETHQESTAQSLPRVLSDISSPQQES